MAEKMCFGERCTLRMNCKRFSPFGVKEGESKMRYCDEETREGYVPVLEPKPPHPEAKECPRQKTFTEQLIERFRNVWGEIWIW